MLEMVPFAVPADHTPNLWGALGCSVGYAGALFTTLDAFGDYVELRRENPVLRLGQRLKYSGKLSGAGITVFSAGTVLALDSNWFALVVLSLVFSVIVGGSWVLARRVRALGGTAAASAPISPGRGAGSATP